LTRACRGAFGGFGAQQGLGNDGIRPMWWRLTKTIIVSWLIGVICGAVLVVVLERRDQTATPVAAGDQTMSRPNAAAPASPDTTDR
jgi:hypothetical protein